MIWWRVSRQLEDSIFTLEVDVVFPGASFNNFLDALDASYCTFEGGDDPNQDATYPDPYGGGYEGQRTFKCTFLE